MVVYGFVLGERLNLVMQDEILSICTFIIDGIRKSTFLGLSRKKDKDINAYGVHLASFPLLLEGRDFDVAQEITTLAEDSVLLIQYIYMVVLFLFLFGRVISRGWIGVCVN